ncbi:MAG TPA: M50 family metallopeptidase [Planctomycetaceae bacterium]|nr:M50 family metallopeptidase [Planctomycetaceae bacterium]
MKCDHCGIESPLDAAFRPIVRVFQKPWRYCPTCVNRRDRLLSQRSLLIALLFGAPLSAIAVAIAPPQDRHFLLFAPSLLIFFWLGIVPHELGHALAASLLGLRVFRIQIGFWGPVLLRLRMFGTEICVTPVPGGGLTVVGAPSLNSVGWRWALMVAAGPLANGVLAVAALCLRPGFSWIEQLVVPFAAANLLIVAVSLFPWHHTTPFGSFESDGLVLLSFPFASRETFAKRHILYFVQEGVEEIRRKNYPAAIDWAERGLRAFPTDNSIRSLLGVAQLGLDDFSTARNTFIECLNACGEDLGQRALLLNNIAWTDLFADDPSLLEEADRYSEEALRIGPWFSWAQGTRGGQIRTSRRGNRIAQEGADRQSRSSEPGLHGLLPGDRIREKAMRGRESQIHRESEKARSRVFVDFALRKRTVGDLAPAEPALRISSLNEAPASSRWRLAGTAHFNCAHLFRERRLGRSQPCDRHAER